MITASQCAYQALDLRRTHNLTYREIGQRLDVTGSRARQLVMDAERFVRRTNRGLLEHLDRMSAARLGG